MPEFLVKVRYLGIKKEIFFGGNELNYYQFQVVNSTEIPDLYFAFPEQKTDSFIYILESHLRKQVKKTSLVKDKNYIFTLNLEKIGAQKTINFGQYTDYGNGKGEKREFKNTLILKSSNYFQRALKSGIEPTDQKFNRQTPT